jgi:hypothetical protein
MGQISETMHVPAMNESEGGPGMLSSIDRVKNRRRALEKTYASQSHRPDLRIDNNMGTFGPSSPAVSQVMYVRPGPLRGTLKLSEKYTQAFARKDL